MPTLLVFLALVIMALISRFTSINSVITYSVGIVLGSILMLLVIRKIGRRAYKSALYQELIFNITAFRLRQKPIKEEVLRIQTDADLKEIKEVLREQMKFTPAQTKDALDHVERNIPEATLEVKITEAIRFLGNGHKEASLK